MAERTRDLLWADAEGIYRNICAHPFVTGLTDGSLPRDRFRHYLVQDSHYLRGYARALVVCAARAPGQADLVMFAEHATAAIAAERQLHAELLGDLGLNPAAAAALPVAPVTHAYVSHLLAITHGGSYAEAVAAVLPCYWIYARVGEHLQSCGSVDRLFARWIEMYAGEEYRQIVEAVLDVVDRVGAAASQSEVERMRAHFHTSARYEWMFFDGAYQMEDWPV